MELFGLNNKQTPLSHVNGLVVCGHSSFFECLRKSRMGVASTGNVFGGSTVLEGQHTFCNHLTSVGADDPDAENLISLLSLIILTRPSELLLALALELAEKGNFPTLYLTPSSFNCSSDFPTLATSG